MCERPFIVVCYFSEAVECDFSVQATSGFSLARINPLTDKHFFIWETNDLTTHIFGVSKNDHDIYFDLKSVHKHFLRQV